MQNVSLWKKLEVVCRVNERIETSKRLGSSRGVIDDNVQILNNDKEYSKYSLYNPKRAKIFTKS